MNKKKFKLTLSKHAYIRILERITSMSFSDAEDFALREIQKSKITLTQLLDDGTKAIAYINKDIKYIVKGKTIVTIYTTY
ncbi:hypothetical protein WMO40_02595 [Bacillaceae bacterium CLA-AA-H227]|uniref:Uncharacterized protein n=1 Tax=Robertmurraya yapensis (ex Hitch et al 2024) TaxID=3133160 RepID=A0ACC6S6R5_9BACI